MNPPATLETARLRLRPVVLDDAAIMFATWVRDPLPRDAWCYARVKETP